MEVVFMLQNTKRLFIISLIFAVSILAVLTTKTQAAAPVNIRLAVFSDPHYFAPEYITQGQAFSTYLARDRKLIAESNAILSKTIESIKSCDAQIVLITGDLTKDGEKLSHIQVSAYLKQLKDAGKQVLVIPGNHDINNPHAVKYSGDNTAPVDRVTPDEFRKIYNDYGYCSAIAEDPNSLSYVVEPLPGLWIIAIDSCSYDNNITNGTPATGSNLNTKRLNWIYDQLKQAKEKNIMVIGMMHHGLVPHFSMEKTLFSAYVIDDWENISSEFADLGMKVVFTGHFHAQDIANRQTKNNNIIYDIETGSLVTYPCPYRLISLTDSRIDIETSTIHEINYDTQGKPFPQYAADFLTKGLSDMVPQFLADLFVKRGMSKNDALIAAKKLAETKLTPSCTIQALVVDALKSHYIGDEVYDDTRRSIVSKLQASANQKIKLLGNSVYSLYNDSPTPDNNVIINF
jgi:3',5'-cyclic AMP phosphodiesterase CpdA